MRSPPSQKLHILPHKHTCMRTRTQNTYLQLYPTHTSLLYVFHVVCVGMRIYLSVSACLCASLTVCVPHVCVCVCDSVRYLMSAVTSQSVWAHNKRQ